MSASEAFHHETTLMKDPVTILLLADRKYCPSLRDVNNLYEKCRKTTKGPSSGSETFDYLQECVTTYNKDKMNTGGKYFCKGLTTTRSKRNHCLQPCLFAKHWYSQIQ